MTIIIVSWTFEKVLRAEIAIAGLLDRDYRSQEEIDGILKETRATVPHFHILDGKEIENYLLVPSALTHAVNDRLKERKAHESVSEKYVVDMLLRLADEMKSSVLSQWISNRMRFFDNRTSKDPATVSEEAIANLDKEWHSPRARLMVVPGKSLLSAFNTELQNKFSISITSTQIIRNLNSTKVASDLKEILHDLNEFAKAPPPGTLITASR